MSEEGEIDELKEEIEALKGEIEGANAYIDYLEEEIDNLHRRISDLEDEALNDKNKTESDHIKMLEKFMIDNGFILGIGKTMGSLLWELGRQIHMLKKGENDYV